ncbi:MAG: 30S ribosomal protein S20 [Planctomycetota bacterium]|jgi:small subunit ribosomal protein S20
MTSSLSAAKRVRQNEKARIRNKTRASAMKTAIRRVDEAIESGDVAAIKAAVAEAYKRIDKCAQTNVLHANTAAHRKSLIARKASAAAS